MAHLEAADYPEDTPRRGYRFLLVAAAAALAVGWLVYSSTQGNSVYYMQVNELLGKGAAVQGQQVRVAGKVEPGSIQRDGAKLTFVAADSGGRVRIAYDGVVPDIFKDNVDVVVEGNLTRNGVFEANTLLAKCPSKFEAAPGTTASREGS